MIVMEICEVGNIYNMSKFRHLIKISQHKHNMNNSFDKNMNSNKI